MADIVTNTLQIGNDKLILRDADAQEKVTGLKEELNDNVSDLKGALNDTGIVSIYAYIIKQKYIKASDGKWYNSSTVSCSLIPVKGGDVLVIKTTSYSADYAALTSAVMTGGTTASFSSDENWTSVRSVAANSEITVVIPSDAKYLYIYRGTTTVDRYPTYAITLNGYDIMQNARETILETIHGVQSLPQENLLPYQYSSGKEYNRYGVKFKVNEDLTLTADSGEESATEDAHYYFVAVEQGIKIRPGTYTLSGITGGSQSTYLLYGNFAGTEISLYDGSKTFTIASEGVYSLRLIVKSGQTVDNVVVSPMLESGPFVHAYKKPTSHEDVSDIILNSALYQCARSYYLYSRFGYFTYGNNNAFDFSDESAQPTELNCSCFAGLVVGGCPFYLSRYIAPDKPNRFYTAGYGFNFYQYARQLVDNGDATETAYLGEYAQDMPDELIKQGFYKYTWLQAQALDRWGFTFDILDNGAIDESKLKVGDLIYYGSSTPPEEQNPEKRLLNGYYIKHCNIVSDRNNMKLRVFDAGYMPIGHVNVRGMMTNFDYAIAARVPLF